MPEYEHQLATDLSHQLIRVLAFYRSKPYLPVWGELFCVLRDFQKLSGKLKRDLLLYSLEPVGELLFDHQSNRFVAKIDEIHLRIQMNLEECIDSLLQGRFPPKKGQDPTPL